MSDILNIEEDIRLSKNNYESNTTQWNGTESILDKINSSEVRPLSLQHNGNGTISSDAPEGVKEFNGLVIGDLERQTVLIFSYGQSEIYYRDIFQKAWLGGWKQLK